LVYAAERGRWNLELDTTTEQYAARAFYEKHGYRAVEVRQASHAEQIIYEKTLDRRFSSTAPTR
jgi:hypothetical protein